MRDQLLRAYHIARKDIKAYYLKPPLISWGIMFPLVLILAFYIRNPTGFTLLTPGLVAMTILFGATSWEAIVIAFEKRIGALERLLIAPVEIYALLLGKTASGATFGFLSSLVILAILAPTLPLQVTRPLLLLAALLLSATVFSLLGVFLSLSVTEVFEAMTMLNLFRFPMIFLSGVFIPLKELPYLLKPVALCLPLTYSVDALQHLTLGGGGDLNLYVDLAVLLGSSLALFTISIWIFKRRLDEMY